MKVFGINNHKPHHNANIIEDEYKFQNILNVFGWFPMLGAIVGTIRIGNTILVYIQDDNSDCGSHKKYYVVSTARGVTEIFALGFLCVVPDLLTSIATKRKLKKENKK